MKIIQIGEEKSTLILNAITQIVNCYFNNEKIDAIYMSSYNAKINVGADKESNNKSLRKPTIELVLVYNSSDYKKESCDFDQVLKKVNRRTGVQLIVSEDSCRNYSAVMMHQREFRACRDLVNGTIIFDRTGEYTVIKSRLLKQGGDVVTPFTNSIEFEPPIQLVKTINN